MVRKHSNSLRDSQEYAFSVQSLYGNRSPLTQGLFGYGMVALLVYLSTRDPAYLIGTISCILVYLARTLDFNRFDREWALGSMSLKRAQYWELRYIVGSTAAVSNMSLMACYSFYRDESIVAMVATLGISISALVSIVGRNFGSSRNVDIMCLAVSVPIVIGTFLSGDIYLALIGCAFLPMVTSTRKMASLVRMTVHKAWASANEVKVLADQFQTALDNMAHGLFMVDADGRIAVANRKAGELLGQNDIDPSEFEGRDLLALLRFARIKKLMRVSRADTIISQCKRLLSGESNRELMELSSDRFFDVSSTLREGRGVVLSFEDASDRIQSEREVTRLARYDSLSNLPNRSWMVECIAEARAASQPDHLVVFSVFDIDRFKQINDTLGHTTGDRVIHHVGKALNEVAAYDSRVRAARLGGDEFVLAFVGVAPEENPESLLDKAYAHIVGNHLLNGKRIDVRVSGGVIIQKVRDFDLDEALIKADLALYQSKKSDSTTWTLFERSMDENYRRKQDLTREFRRALSDGELSAAYQPMLTPDGKNVMMCEALARWTHPEKGNIPPYEFIAIAEEIGLVTEVTRQMLRNACRECVTWPEHMSVSVNLSAIDLENPKIVDMISEALLESGLSPERLQVEITETILATDMDRTRRILSEIRGMGVKTALDDFGTGYSSMSYLYELPIDKLKFDRTFVANILNDKRAENFLKSMISFAHDLGFEIVAEGIETDEQLQKVRELGDVTLVQGWVFGRPMPSHKVLEFATDLAAKQLRSDVPNVVRFKAQQVV